MFFADVGQFSMNPLQQIVDRNTTFGLSQKLSPGESGTCASPDRNMSIWSLISILALSSVLYFWRKKNSILINRFIFKVSLILTPCGHSRESLGELFSCVAHVPMSAYGISPALPPTIGATWTTSKSILPGYSQVTDCLITCGTSCSFLVS